MDSHESKGPGETNEREGREAADPGPVTQATRIGERSHMHSMAGRVIIESGIRQADVIHNSLQGAKEGKPHPSPQ